MIGLSLSFCIKDIAAGKIAESDVSRIISCTKANSPQEWEEVFEQYEKVYWKDFPEARVIATRFLSKRLIEQPRLDNDKKVPIIGSGHWVKSMSDIHWGPDVEDMRAFLKNASIGDPGPNQGLNSRRIREGVFEE